MAKRAGADVVKFQCYFGTQPKYKDYEFTAMQWFDLDDYCKRKNIAWFATPFDYEAITFLRGLGMKRWKVASGFASNEKFMRKIREASDSINGEVILSTGMCFMIEVERAVRILNPKYVLQCTSLYPCPPEQTNLAVLRNPWFNGFSSHTRDIHIVISAIALGAQYVEVHVHSQLCEDCPDHAVSLRPDELARFVRQAREVEAAMGSTQKHVTAGEGEVRAEIRERCSV